MRPSVALRDGEAALARDLQRLERWAERRHPHFTHELRWSAGRGRFGCLGEIATSQRLLEHLTGLELSLPSPMERVAAWLEHHVTDIQVFGASSGSFRVKGSARGRAHAAQLIARLRADEPLPDDPLPMGPQAGPPQPDPLVPDLFDLQLALALAGDSHHDGELPKKLAELARLARRDREGLALLRAIELGTRRRWRIIRRDLLTFGDR